MTMLWMAMGTQSPALFFIQRQDQKLSTKYLCSFSMYMCNQHKLWFSQSTYAALEPQDPMVDKHS